MITQERLRELLNYEQETGVFVWLLRSGSDSHTSAWNARFAGKVAGNLHRGYREISIDNRYCMAHRLAWLYVHGELPAAFIDHINGDRADNRIANLREATRSQNGQNRGANKNNTSGHKGVTWRRSSRKWHAKIRASSKTIHLGFYDCPEEAAAAYAAAADKYHGEFSRIE